MNGPDHYREAERLAAVAGDPAQSLAHQTQYAALAQVYATLALAAATAWRQALDGQGRVANQWRGIVYDDTGEGGQ